MPLDRDEWNKGRRITDMERLILQFLKGNRTHAYSASEILGALYPLKVSNLWDVGKQVLVSMGVDSSLKNLVRDGSVKVKQVNYEAYYVAA